MMKNHERYAETNRRIEGTSRTETSKEGEEEKSKESP